MTMADVDTIAVYSGGPAARVDWLGAKVDGRSALSYMIYMNQVNTGNGCHDESTINIIK